MNRVKSQKLKKFNRALSVLLTAVMVAGSVPDVSLVVHATEAGEEISALENVSAEDPSTEEQQSSEDNSSAEEQQPSEENSSTEESISEEASSAETTTETNAEEDKESEATSSETSEAVSTEEESEDNTAGEEETTEPGNGAGIEEVEDEEETTYTAVLEIEYETEVADADVKAVASKTEITEESSVTESDADNKITLSGVTATDTVYLTAKTAVTPENPEYDPTVILGSETLEAKKGIYELGTASDLFGADGKTKPKVKIGKNLVTYEIVPQVKYKATADGELAKEYADIESSELSKYFNFQDGIDAEKIVEDNGTYRIKRGNQLDFKVTLGAAKDLAADDGVKYRFDESAAGDVVGTKIDPAAKDTKIYVPKNATTASDSDKNKLVITAYVVDVTNKVTLKTGNDNGIEIKTFKIGDADAHDYADEEEGTAWKTNLSGATGVPIAYGDTFEFTFTVQTTPQPSAAAEGASIAEEGDSIPVVKAGDKIIVPEITAEKDSENVTTYKASYVITAETAFTIEAATEAADYTLTLDENGVGEITLTGGQYYIQTKNVYYLDTAADLTFKTTRGEGLGVGKDYKVVVKVGAVEVNLEPAADGTYTLPKTAITGNVTIKLEEVDLTSTLQEIGILNVAGYAIKDIQYMANENKNEYVKWTSGNVNAYTEKDFLIKFRTDDGYTAVVANGEDSEAKGYKTYTAEKTEGIYAVYRIPKEDIEDGFKIVIGVTAPEATVEYDETQVAIDKAILTGDWGATDYTDAFKANWHAAVKETVDGQQVIKTPAHSTWRVLEGETLTIEASAKAGYVITGAKDNKITLTVKGGDKATITATADYTVALKQGSTVLETVNNIYNVNTGIEYTVTLGNGAGASTAIKGLELKAGSKVVGTSTNDKFTVSADNEGKKLTVDVKAEVEKTGEDGKKTKETQVVKSFQINVQKSLTGVTVAGVKNGELSQAIGSTAEYAVTVQPKGAAAELETELSSADQKNIEAEIADGKLKITAKAVKPCTAEVKIKLKGSKASDAALATVKVNVVSPAAGKKPTVKVNYTTDTELLLTLGAAKLPALGSDEVKYAYHVTATKGTDSTKGGLGKGADVYIPIDGTTASQDALVGVFGEKVRGEGGVCEFSVVATLVVLNAPELNDDGYYNIKKDDKKILDETEATAPVATATKDPYFETKLTLKKGAGTVHTGQDNAVIAVPVFTKEATYIRITARDITANISPSYKIGGSSNIFSFENGQLMADIGSNVSIGKHTIEVVAEADNIPNIDGKEVHNMYSRIAVATITVNVVRGITSLSLQAPTTIYKEAGKAASYTVKPIYNGGSADWKPKTAKVTGWKIVAPYGETAVSENVRNNISINSSGKITVNKNYTVKPGDGFRVYAKAADYAGNTEESYSSNIMITSTVLALTSLAVVKYDTVAEKYIVVAVNGDTVESGELRGAYIQPLKREVTKGAEFSDDEWYGSYTLGRTNYTYTTKSKNVILSPWGNVNTVTNTGKVTVTVKSNIGGKAVSKNIAFTVGYPDTNKLDITFKQGNEAVREAGAVNTDFSIAGTGAVTLNLAVQESHLVDGETQYYDLVNHANIEVTSDKGGKIIKSGFLNGKPYAGLYNDSYKLVVTGRTAKVTLKADKKVVKTYTVTNTAYSDAKAPTAKIASGNYIANTSIKQNVEIQFKKLNAADSFAVVEIDETARNAKNYYLYSSLASYFNGRVIPIDGDTVVIPSYANVLPGSYKLKVTVGTTDINHNLIPSSKTINVTLKAVAEKFPIKPATSYTVTAKDAGLKFTGKGKYDSLVITDIYNDNVGGRSNSFDQYFKIATVTVDDEEINTDVLSLTEKAFDKSGALAEDLQNGPVTGWVDYTVTAKGISYSGTAKISVKVTTDSKSKQKYTIDKATVLTGTDAVVSLKLNGTEVPVKAVAAATDEKLNKNGVTAAVDKENNVATGKIKLGNLSVKGSNKVTLYVIPAGSYYTDKADPLTCGIEVAATIDVRDEAAKNKIKLANTKLDIVNYDNTGAQMYSVKVPYSIVVSGSKVAKAEVVLNDKANKPDKNNAFSIVEKAEKDFAGNYFTIQIKKSDVEGTDFGYSTAKKAKTAKVPVKITFAAGAEETYSLTLKMPVKADNTYEAALDNIESNNAAIKAAATPMMTVKTFQVSTENESVGGYTAWELDSIIAATDALKAKLDDVVGNGSDVLVLLTQTLVAYDAAKDEYTGHDKLAGSGDDEYAYEAPTTITDGTITFKVNVYDMSVTKYDTKTQKPNDKDAVYTEFTFTVSIPKFGKAAPDDIRRFFTAGDPYTEWGGSDGVASSTPEWYTKDTTKAQIIAKAGEELQAWAAAQSPALDVSNIRFKFAPDSYSKDNDGVTTGKLVAFNAYNSNDEYTTSHGFVFSPTGVNSLDQAVSAVEAYLTEIADGSIYITKATTFEEVKELLKPVINNDAIEILDSKSKFDNGKADVASVSEFEANPGTNCLKVRIVLRDTVSGKVEKCKSGNYYELKYLDDADNVIKAYNAVDEALTDEEIIEIVQATADSEGGLGTEGANVKAAIVKAANDTLTATDVVAATSADGKLDSKFQIQARVSNGFNFEAPDWKTSTGSVMIILELCKKDETTSILPESEAITCDVTLAADMSILSVDEAGAKAEDRLNDTNPATRIVVTNDTTGDAIITELYKVIDEDRFALAYDKKTVTVDGESQQVDDFTLEPATVKKAGSIKGKIKIAAKFGDTGTASTISGDYDTGYAAEVITFTLTIPKLTQTAKEAADAVSAYFSEVEDEDFSQIKNVADLISAINGKLADGYTVAAVTTGDSKLEVKNTAPTQDKDKNPVDGTVVAKGAVNLMYNSHVIRIISVDKSITYSAPEPTTP